MHFDLKRPCVDCPFRREGGIRLSQGRLREIALAMLERQGATFACHATVTYDDEGEYVPDITEQHCAGALIFAEKQGRCNQPTRMAERLGLYDAAALMADAASVAAVVDSLREMLEVNRAVIPAEVP